VTAIPLVRTARALWLASALLLAAAGAAQAEAEAVATIPQEAVTAPHATSSEPTLFFGLSLGSVLLLAGIGLAITFGVMGVINMAARRADHARRLHDLCGAAVDAAAWIILCWSRYPRRSWSPAWSASPSSAA
jgi:hypothetical protein